MKPTLDNPEFVPEWDVYRDQDGKPVTLNADQVYAIWHGIHVVELVRKAESARPLEGTPEGYINWRTELYKSRLLGRMLLEGRPPTKTKPPMSFAGPDWSKLPGGDPFGDPRTCDLGHPVSETANYCEQCGSRLL
jgi:hypothetical protein